MKQISIATLTTMKANREKFACLTAYDASFAKLFDSQDIEVLLIGDSLGMVLKGEQSTLGVSTDEVAYHVKSVKSGVERALIIADMPFMSYATPHDACINAGRLMASGANMVKIEGGHWVCETVSTLVERGIPVCGHLGLTPQMVNVFGGFKVQGRHAEQAQKIIDDAQQLQDAGAQLLVLECVPVSLAETITSLLEIPTIGIGAGNATDGQILVMHDMLGISANYMPKFTKNYLQECNSIQAAVAKYRDEVKRGDFPSAQHSFK